MPCYIIDAIQTLRNAITANTFLASTVLSLFTLTAGYLRANLNAFDLITLVSFSPLLGLLMCSAYSFSQSARLMTHVGFMFPVAKETSTVLTYASVERLMLRSEHCQWWGLRYLYLSMCPVAWIFGGEFAFLVVSVALLRFLQQIDRPPPLEHVDSMDNSNTG